MEKKLTDEEIVKALEKCRERPYCEVKCEYKLARTGAECIPKLMGIALDLIHRQKAEIERLTKLAELRKRDNDDTCKLLFEAEEDKSRLQKQVDELKSDYVKGYEAGVDEGWENAVKDTAKEILQMFDDRNYISESDLKKAIAERYGVSYEENN